MDTRDDWDRHWADLYDSTQYSPAQTYRRELLIYWLRQQSPAAASHLLDIGSGQGDLIASISRVFPQIELAGVEISSTGIAQAQVKTPTARFFQRDLQIEPEANDPLMNWAELSVCCEVLEHVDEPEKVLTNAVKYLAPGARLFITVPGGPMSAFDRHIGHRRHYNTESLGALIRSAGLVPEQISGVGFPFFNLYRMTVILRGESLIEDARAEATQMSWAAKSAMRAFSLVLKPHLNSHTLGWQMVAQARKPT
jgi:trans-aconitate methyltransferase